MSDEPEVWVDFGLDIHRCNPSGGLNPGDIYQCPECDKVWVAKAAIMWTEVA